VARATAAAGPGDLREVRSINLATMLAANGSLTQLYCGSGTHSRDVDQNSYRVLPHLDHALHMTDVYAFGGAWVAMKGRPWTCQGGETT
jgi:hypothetical protein